MQALHRMRWSGLLWLVASAALFLLGASSFGGAGMKEVAALGVAGAIAAIAMIVAFFV
ncbi:MAG: hypothetical protein ABI369_02805 [Acetobacteraceae bacterium]